METIRIDNRTWSIEDGFVRCFLIAGNEKALLVDSGVSGDGARAAAESLTKLPLELINLFLGLLFKLVIPLLGF